MYARRLLFGFITVVLVLSCVTFFTSFDSVCDRTQAVKHSTTIRNQTKLIYVRDESLCNCDYNYTDVEYQCDSVSFHSFIECTSPKNLRITLYPHSYTRYS